MARKKKNGNKNTKLATIVFVTAIINLIQSLVDLLKKLIE